MKRRDFFKLTAVAVASVPAVVVAGSSSKPVSVGYPGSIGTLDELDKFLDKFWRAMKVHVPRGMKLHKLRRTHDDRVVACVTSGMSVVSTQVPVDRLLTASPFRAGFILEHDVLSAVDRLQDFAG